MGRIRVNDFSAGQIDLVEPDLIPDNAVQVAENVEFDVVGTLNRRTRPSNHAVIHALIQSKYDTVSDFYIWYPANKVDGANSDGYVLIVYGELISQVVYSIRLYYRNTSDVWRTEGLSIINANLTTASEQALAFSIFEHKLLMTSSELNVQSIYVDKIGDIYDGEEGIRSALSKAIVSDSESENEYIEIDSDNTGMTLYKGSVLSYCYTQVDKLGVESNPSPIIVFDSLNYLQIDDTTGTHEFYWKKTLLNELRTIIAESDDYVNLKENIKYFKIYRTDSLYVEGTVTPLPLRLVATIDVADIDEDNTFVDIFPYGSEIVSYENDIASSGVDLCSVSKVNFIGGAQSDSKFPFEFEHKMKIKLTNNNDNIYLDKPFMVEIKDTDLVDEDSAQVFTWSSVLTSGVITDPEKFRFYAGDMITPLSTTYRQTATSVMLFEIKIPKIATGYNFIYMTYADSEDGDTVTYADTATAVKYGEWLYISSAGWDANQCIFKANRVRNQNNFICTSHEEHNDDSSYNRADRNNDGAFSANASWVDNPIEFIKPFGLPAKSISFECTDDKNAVQFTGLTYEKVDFPTAMPETNKGTISFYLDVNTMNVADDDYIIKLYADANNYLYIRVNFVGLGNARLIAEYHNDSGGASTSLIVGTMGTFFIMFSWDDTDARFGWYDLLDDSEGFHVSSSFYPPSGDLGIEYCSDGATSTTVSFSQFNVDANLYVDTVDGFYQMMNFSPIFPTAWIGYHETDAENKNITIDPIQSVVNERDNGHVLRWSELGGSVYPDLNFKIMDEPIKRVLTAPSFLQFEYQNTILIFTRNSVSRFVLEGTPDGWASSTSNLIREQQQLGLLSDASAVMTGDAVLWLSEVGMILWDSKGIRNISRDIIDIPIDETYLGLYIPTKNQYWLHDETNSKTFVFDLSKGAWTTFTGLSIVKSRTMSGGDQLENINLLLEADYDLVYYPTAYLLTTPETKVTTKKFPVPYEMMFRRFRIDFSHGAGSPIETTTDIDNKYSSAPTSVVAPTGRMIWAGLANGSFGENIQIEIRNIDELKKIEIDIHERS